MLFILNKNYEVVESLNNRGNMAVITPYFDDEYLQNLSTGAETFTFSTLADSVQSQHLVVGNFIAFRYKNEYKLFNIINVDEEHTDLFIKNVYCEMSSIELINEIVRPMKFSGTVRAFCETILSETSWQLGSLDMGFSQVFDLDLTDYKTVYTLLQEHIVNTFGAELSYRVVIKNNKIVGKYVDVFARRGSDKGLRFAYSKNLTSVKRTVDTSNIATALIGIGNSNITFRDLDLEDKPAGQDFIVDETAYRLWGVNGHHIMGTFKAETDSPQELLKLTREELAKRSTPNTKYEMKVELLGEEVNIGDTVKIVDHSFNPPIHLEGRVNQLIISHTDPTRNECVLANFKEIGSNITKELKELAGYVESKFPIGSSDIQDGAINGDKLQDGQIIKGTHLFANSITADKIQAGEITTEHLQANSITADKLTTDELITQSAQIGNAIIDSMHLKEGSIDSVHINEGTINSAHIQDASIGTAQIKDAEITVAKIQDAFIDNLVANQGKFQSAHIGVLTSDNIDATTIKAEHITSSVIDAINMSVSGTIDASKINVSDLVVDNIDADKITSGTIDADRINGSVITAINASIENAVIDSAKIGELSADKITSGSISTDILKSNVITAINASIGKISADHIDVSSIKVDKLDASAIVSGTIDADRITSSVVQAINLSSDKISANNINVEGLQVGGANILEGSIQSANIGKGQIKNAHINDAFIADAYIKNLNASVITAGTLDTSKIAVSSTKGNLTIQDNTIQVKDNNKKVRVQLGEDKTGDYGLIITNANGEVMWDFTGASALGIQDGAIENDKIKDNEITADKLVIDSIWANDAFVANFKSANIDAGQITTGKIKGELIDIQGLVKFSDLNEELAQNFVRPTDANGNITGTFINGASIHTGTLYGDQIIANGFTAKDKLDNMTFNIDKDSGEVTVRGEVKSMNYSSIVGNEQGYRLTPNGDAYLNDATIRGSLIAPDAGITNYGGKGRTNLLRRTDFDFLTLDQVKEYWQFNTSNTNYRISTYNGGANEEENSPIIDKKVLRQAVDLTTGTTQGYLNPLGENKKEYITLEPNTTYTYSCWIYKGGNCDNLQFTLWGYDDNGGSRTNIKSTKITEYKGKFEKFVFTFTTDTRKNYQLRFYNNAKSTVTTGESIVYYYQPKLEMGDSDTDYNSNVDDNIKYVRFWAGDEYKNRGDAPFIVYSDGSIKATEGEFGGVFSGKVNIGNIHIEDDDKSQGSITIKDNTDTTAYVHLNENHSYFNSKLDVGKNFVSFVPSDKSFTVNKGDISFKGTNSKYLNFPSDTGVVSEYGYTSDTYGDYKHELWYTQGTLHHNAYGTKKEGVPDFRFSRDRGDSLTSVEVKGELKVTDKITMNNKIAIVARQDSGNSGFDYVVN